MHTFFTSLNYKSTFNIVPTCRHWQSFDFKIPFDTDKFLWTHFNFKKIGNKTQLTVFSIYECSEEGVFCHVVNFQQRHAFPSTFIVCILPGPHSWVLM